MATTTMSKRIPTAKIEAVEELVNLIKSIEVLGIAKAEGIGAKQIQRLRKVLEGQAKLKVTKNTLIRLALNECADEKTDITKLADYLTGSNIFIFAKMDPFKLTRILDQNKMRTLAKPGQIAPEDIVVPAGNTGFPPGPLITEFSNVGLPTRIDAGNIAITKDTVVAKEGEIISKQLALVLSRLGIEPMEVGLTLEFSYEDGLLLQKEDLQIDIDEIRGQFTEAASQALNLAINIAYAAPETIRMLILKAYMDSIRLAEITSFVAPETLPFMEYVYGAMLLHSAKQKITEDALNKVLSAAGLKPETARAKALVAALEEVDIEEALKTAAAVPVATTVTVAAPAEEVKAKKDKKEEEKEEEDTGLGALFG
jgi:large subunit ribosomal protein L10